MLSCGGPGHVHSSLPAQGWRVISTCLSSCLPCLVCGWQGGDMTTMSGARVRRYSAPSPVMLRWRLGAAGWLWRYTALLTVLMSTAATTCQSQEIKYFFSKRTELPLI